MKIIGISCSPRKGKSSYYILQKSFEELNKININIKTEIIDLGGLQISGCKDCGFCKTKLDCGINDDFKNIITLLNDPEIKGIIIATPVYLGSMTSLCKAFLERTVMFRRNGFLFRDKVGSAIAVGGVRNGGQEFAVQSVHAALLCHDMIIAGDGYNTAHYGGICYSGGEGGIEADESGLKTAFNTIKRCADLIFKLYNK